MHETTHTMKGPKHNFVIFPVLFLLFLAVQSCEKEDVILERDYPRIDINGVVSQDASGITLEGQFLTQKGDILDKGFTWRESSTPFLHNSPMVSAGEGYGSGTFQATAQDDFIPGTEYNVRAFAITAEKTIYSRTITIKYTLQ